MMTNPPSSERVGQEPVTATDPSTGSGQARDYGRMGFEADRAWRLAHWSVLPAYIGTWQDLGDDDRARYRCIAHAVRAAVVHDLPDHPRDPSTRSGQAHAGERGAAIERRLAVTIAAYRETVTAALADSGDEAMTETICETEQHLDDDARSLIASVPETHRAVLDWLDNAAAPVPARGGTERDWRITRSATSIEIAETWADADHDEENGSVVLRTDHDNLLALAQALCPSDHRVISAAEYQAVVADDLPVGEGTDDDV